MFLNSKESISLDVNNVPKHVAIIMDGNGRWAQKRHLPRIAGHKKGMNVVEDVTIAASEIGVKVLTLYAFSTENWKRPEDEVNYIMSLPEKFFDKFVPKLIENNVSVRVMGLIDQLPASTKKAVDDAVSKTSHCTGMILNFALNYGSRMEITDAVKKISQQVKDNQLLPSEIDEKIIDANLMTGYLEELSDPDVVIRTSGEERISNFLLWQIAYSEFIFTDILWPDITKNSFLNLILEYQSRNRRFGGLKNK
ncbi:isoprenyl transferase [Lentilactobacillus laojiaonis]|uniref:isoprenyl transferase n=1 Tax=Lentilactobacillus laojiaonis TaxID=2883998 RepID=UPI001D0AF4DF|nr:isoprenyl transferase [Lentilactobacillus laojiaonis]UDM31660.1 isoprenyl transferase [Lentilactobacillus laojiaonis]